MRVWCGWCSSTCESPASVQGLSSSGKESKRVLVRAARVLSGSTGTPAWNSVALLGSFCEDGFASRASGPEAVARGQSGEGFAVHFECPDRSERPYPDAILVGVHSWRQYWRK
jgi:hypothetical protein